MTQAALSPLAALPSPSTAVWHLGPLPVRAYALCIVLGIVVACWVTDHRMRQRGAPPWAVLDLAVWAVPFGIVGARIYHVITSPQAYFGDGGHPLDAFKIWEGGLGIWGAVAGGAVGAWLGCRQLGMPLTFLADTMAPGLALAQAVGRWGNWFNNELHGGSTSLPWGMKVHQMDPNNPGHALVDADGKAVLLPGLYHPAFLYESLWDAGVAVLVWQAEKRFKLGKGRAFALYVMAYTAGRLWIEALRTDEANHILGLRLNIWTCLLVFAGALVYFLRVRGPREFVIPILAEGDGDMRPVGYRVVTEEQFERYKATGEVPEGEPEPASGAAQPAGEAEPAKPPGEPAKSAGEPAKSAGEPEKEPSGDAEAETEADARS